MPGQIHDGIGDLEKYHLRLKSLDDLADQTPGNAVRLDHDEGLLVVGHVC